MQSNKMNVYGGGGNVVIVVVVVVVWNWYWNIVALLIHGK
jgi:CobQ-like glutamine amidotransferase family enzyme